ncbi:MAG: hypothetical protein QF554_11500 [Dehalococcoidia bacterium]|jgi:hypothetical protein|nr:hypothetical protein [Dehalococcoidia bacterium]
MSPQYVYTTIVTPLPGRGQDIVDKIIEYKTKSRRTRGFCTISIAAERQLITNNLPFDQDLEALQSYVEELASDPYSVEAWAEIAAMSANVSHMVGEGIAGMDPNPLTGNHDAPYLERVIFRPKPGERDAVVEKLMGIRELLGAPQASVSRPATGNTGVLMMMRMITDFKAIGEFRTRQEEHPETRAAYAAVEGLCESVEREYARLVRLVRRADE